MKIVHRGILTQHSTDTNLHQYQDQGEEHSYSNPKNTMTAASAFASAHQGGESKKGKPFQSGLQKACSATPLLCDLEAGVVSDSGERARCDSKKKKKKTELLVRPTPPLQRQSPLWIVTVTVCLKVFRKVLEPKKSAVCMSICPQKMRKIPIIINLRSVPSTSSALSESQPSARSSYS